MQRACLIVNPAAGRGSLLALRLTEILEIFSASGLPVQVVETTADPDSARELAEKASKTCDLVIACGGDGSVHGVLQGVAHTSACLGVLPFGTANALARNLGLPLDPVGALRKLLTYKPISIPLGVAETATGIRAFTVMAGAGPDGTLIHEMKHATKMRAGRQAYYAEAARLFATRRFPAFQVEYRQFGSQTWQRREAAAMMTSRIPDLGGIFRGLTRDSRLDHSHLLVHLLTAPAHLSFPAWFAFSNLGLASCNPWLTTVEVEELRCMPLSARHTFAQIDGEPAGLIPMSLRIESNGLRLLMP